jgi:glycosyltransferase involved in cell wall biosynthesis
MLEKVSVVITTKNEEKNIENCLKSIQLQTWNNIEIIVVDNNSADKTKEISRRYTELVFDKGPERSAQRNHGLMDIATGVYGMFIDADMILTPNLVKTCVEKIRTSDAAGLHIDEFVLGRGLLSKIRRFERSFYSGTVIDGVRFFRIDSFSRVGGFDFALPPGPEDWDLDMRLKELGPLKLIPNKSETNFLDNWELRDFTIVRGAVKLGNFQGIYHNEDEQTLKRYLHKKSYYSASMNTYQDKWNGHEELRKQFGITYRYLLVFIERGGWKKLIVHPILTIFMFALRVAVGYRYIYIQMSKRQTRDVYGRSKS